MRSWPSEKLSLARQSSCAGSSRGRCRGRNSSLETDAGDWSWRHEVIKEFHLAFHDMVKCAAEGDVCEPRTPNTTGGCPWWHCACHMTKPTRTYVSGTAKTCFVGSSCPLRNHMTKDAWLQGGRRDHPNVVQEKREALCGPCRQAT